MENLKIYELLRVVPEEAKKTISGGRLKGMTDIKPQWRIMKMTETFGVVGFGWKYEITRLWLEPFGEQIAAFAEIKLYVKIDDQWSEPIPGIGGSMFVAQEKNGAYVSDECYKMAITDALSVAMKMLGVGADVYSGLSDTKYVTMPQNTDYEKGTQPKPEKVWLTELQYKATLECTDIAKVEAVLKKFAIKKIWREEIINHLKTLKNEK